MSLLQRLFGSRKPALNKPVVSSSCLHDFEKEYKHSHTDAIAFVSKLQHTDIYELKDLVTGEWRKQEYTYLVDGNEQETPTKMIHGFRMGWLRPCNCC